MFNKSYSLALLLSIKIKNLTNLSETLGISDDQIKRELQKDPIEIKEVVQLCNDIFKGKKINALADDVLLKKEYARIIEGVQKHFSSSKRIRINSLCIIVITLSDGFTTIPVSFKLWMSKGNYKKTHLLQQLLVELQQYIKIDMLFADGLYATINMIKWLIEQNFKFEMRFHSNRVVTGKGIKAQVKEQKKLKPKGKKFARTVNITWYDMQLFLTAVKFINKDRSIYFRYQISNYKASSRQHANAYRQRWKIEKFFRTSKQYLGLQDSTMRKFSDQSLHIQHVFLAYTILQLFMKLKRLFDNPEAAIKYIRSKNRQWLTNQLEALNQIFT
jgi:hypothetical protein